MSMPKYRWTDVYGKECELPARFSEETDSRMYRRVKIERMYQPYDPLSLQEDYIFPRFSRHRVIR